MSLLDHKYPLMFGLCFLEISFLYWDHRAARIVCVFWAVFRFIVWFWALLCIDSFREPYLKKCVFDLGIFSVFHPVMLWLSWPGDKPKKKASYRPVAVAAFAEGAFENRKDFKIASCSELCGIPLRTIDEKKTMERSSAIDLELSYEHALMRFIYYAAQCLMIASTAAWFNFNAPQFPWEIRCMAASAAGIAIISWVVRFGVNTGTKHAVGIYHFGQTRAPAYTQTAWGAFVLSCTNASLAASELGTPAAAMYIAQTCILSFVIAGAVAHAVEFQPVKNPIVKWNRTFAFWAFAYFVASGSWDTWELAFTLWWPFAVQGALPQNTIQSTTGTLVLLVFALAFGALPLALNTLIFDIFLLLERANVADGNRR